MHWTAGDDLSGLDGADPADSVVTGEGNDLSAAASVTDGAGNTANATVTGIRIDRTAPTTQVSLPDAPTAAGTTGACSSTLATGSDLSGIEATYYSVDAGPAELYTGPFRYSVLGEHTITYWSVDKAGNVEDRTAAGHSVTLKVDGGAPTITGARYPAPNANGWNDGPVLELRLHRPGNRRDGVPGADDGLAGGQRAVRDRARRGRLRHHERGDGRAHRHRQDPTDRHGRSHDRPERCRLVPGRRRDPLDRPGRPLGDRPRHGPRRQRDRRRGLRPRRGVAANLRSCREHGQGRGQRYQDRPHGSDDHGHRRRRHQTLRARRPGDPGVGQGLQRIGRQRLGGRLLRPGRHRGQPNGVGRFTFTAAATDRAGNTRTQSGSYRVIYRWDGFKQPINDTAHEIGQGLSVFKGGSTVPAKLQLERADGTVVQANRPPQWLVPVKGSPTNALEGELLFSDAETSGTDFRWDAGGQQYQYNWSTKGVAAGYQYQVKVALDDGQVYYVTIGLRRGPADRQRRRARNDSSAASAGPGSRRPMPMRKRSAGTSPTSEA